MKAFIIGGSGNGKSAFAEKVAAKLGGKMIYIATMPIFSEEDVKVVERHHKLRAGRGPIFINKVKKHIVPGYCFYRIDL